MTPAVETAAQPNSTKEHRVERKLELMPLQGLTGAEKNPKRHSHEDIRKSIGRFGYVEPIVLDERTRRLVAGHGRLKALRVAQKSGEAPPQGVVVKGGEWFVPVLRGWFSRSDAEAEAYLLASNRVGEAGGWDSGELAELLQSLSAQAALDGTGFDAEAIDQVLRDAAAERDDEPKKGSTDPDDVPAAPAEAKTKPGDLYVLGKHRLLCGDSTKPGDVERLMGGAKAILMHADPPYGMGKEADGVENDNLYGQKLDAFQMSWWRAFRPHVEDNGSAYIWGNAEELWRLWFVGGLRESERFEFRNEIVWDKRSIPGMASDLMLSYPIASERCLFFQFGQQFVGNINAEDFPEAWEPLRAYLAGEATKAGIKKDDIKRVCGCGMFGHWFTRSQFTLIPEAHYEKLRGSYPGHFQRPWSELRSEWQRVRGNGRDVINGKPDGTRSFFDNSHDSMIDVWQFPRVIGDERHGHATPKPVAMIQRALKSSSPRGGLVVEPFIGSGSTLIAAEAVDRVCYGVELSPIYCDVTVRRWEAFTGQRAERLRPGGKGPNKAVNAKVESAAP